MAKTRLGEVWEMPEEMRRKPTRRQFLKTAASVGGTLAASKLSPLNRMHAWAAPIAPRQVKLVVWKHDHPPANAFFRRLFEEYRRTNSNVEFEMATAPTIEYYAKLPAALASGEQVDIFNMSDVFITSLYRRGALDKMNYQALGFRNAAEFEAAHIPGTVEFLKFDGEFYGTAIEYNVFSLGVNSALFRQAGLDPSRDAPRTWNQLFDIGKRLVRMEGDRMVQAGFDSPMRASTTFNLLMTLALAHQYGGNLLSPDARESAMTSDPVVRAFQHWQDIYHTHKLVTPSFGVKTPVAPNEDFAQATVAMYPFAGWGFGTLRGKPAENQVVVTRWPQGLPRTVAQAWLWGLFVNARSRNKEEAWKWISWIFSGRQLEEWLPNTGYINPRKGWFDSPAARRFPYLNVFVEDMGISVTRQKSEKWAEIIRVVNKANDQVILERQPVRQVLAAAHDEANRILRG